MSYTTTLSFEHKIIALSLRQSNMTFSNIVYILEYIELDGKFLNIRFNKFRENSLKEFLNNSRLISWNMTILSRTPTNHEFVIGHDDSDDFVVDEEFLDGCSTQHRNEILDKIDQIKNERY